MTKTKIDKNNRTAMWRRMSTAAILLSAIAFISSSGLTVLAYLQQHQATATTAVVLVLIRHQLIR
jgi:ABC-type transporter Mla MlaB component